MGKKKQPKKVDPYVIDAEYLLVEVFDLLEGGNAKEAEQTLSLEFESLAQQNPAYYFGMLRNAGYDRPSAWWSYAGIVKLPKHLRTLELVMHAEDEDPKVKKKLESHFYRTYSDPSTGKAAFKVLFSNEWDT